MTTDTVEFQTSDAGVTTLSVPFGTNRLIFETGRLAKQAKASIISQVGGTVVLTSVVGTDSPREGIDFFPLMVDYREKFYASGRVPGGFLKRENRPGTGETLRARLIDRPLRPLFPEGLRNEVQVYINVLSYDGKNPAEMAALNAASLALGISDIPFAGPVGAVRIGLVEGEDGEAEFVVNPTIEQQAQSDLDLVVAGTKTAITMVESGANELPEEVMLEALQYAHENIIEICKAQELMIEKLGAEKYAFEPPAKDDALAKKVKTASKKLLADAYKINTKMEQYAAFDEAKAAVIEKLVDADAEDAADQKRAVSELFGDAKKDFMREQTLKGNRCDGRDTSVVRPITIDVGALPRTHGSAVFTRGETQSLGVCTVGTADDEQMIDDLNGVSYQRFYLHYNFPSFSVGEARMPRGPGRREIGHGALAERALLPLVPLDDPEFPYTIRIVSEILESNGSSSMASVCSGSLAMFDAGIPLKRPVAGIAMGLIMEKKDYVILSDISGTEDHLGDMDFKVTGTEEGITALQMDIKIDGITMDIMKEALAQAYEGRKHILGEMNKALPAPREEMSEHAPIILRIQIDPKNIRDIIGSGGSTIKGMQEETGAKINVEDDGTVIIAAVDRGAVKEVQRRIEQLTAEPEVGAEYTGKVVNITNFGAFIEILPGKDGLLHISELEHGRVNRVEDVINLGDTVNVKCIEVDPSGKVRLSRRALLPGGEEAGEGGEGRSERGGRDRDRGERGERDRGGRGGRDRDRDRKPRRDRDDDERKGRRNRDEEDRKPRRDDDEDEDDRPARGRGRGGKKRRNDDDIPVYKRGGSSAKPAPDDDEDEILDDDLVEFEEDDDFEFEEEDDEDIEYNAPGNSIHEDRGGNRGGGNRGGGGRGRGRGGNRGGGGGRGRGGNRGGGGGNRGGNR